MKIIRDNNSFGFLTMIPIFRQFGITRCNVKDCMEKPSTVIYDPENIDPLGVCEKHFQEAKTLGKWDYQLER